MGPPPGVPAPASTNVLAVLSLVFAFVFAPVGAVLGHLGLSQIARTGQHGRTMALVGLVLSYVVIVCVTAALVVWTVSGDEEKQTAEPPNGPVAASPTVETSTTPPDSSAAPAPSGPRVDRAALREILIPLPELRTLADDPELISLYLGEGLVEPQPEYATYSDTSCLGSHLRGTIEAYRGNEPVAYVGEDVGNQTIALGNRKTGNFIRQGVALYADAAAASKAFADYLNLWRGCEGKSTVMTPRGLPPMTFVFGEPAVLAPGLMMVRSTALEATTVDFVHLLAVRANVLVDNNFSGRYLGDLPKMVTEVMLARIAERESR